MVNVLEPIEQRPLVVHTRPALEMDDQMFFKLCQINRDLRLERTAQGDLIIMPPEGGSSGHGNTELAYLFQRWARRDGSGRVFGPSTGFTLPNGATRSPDVSWAGQDRLEALSDEQWERFLPFCPDFVLELRSPSDSLPALKAKMAEYLENGARLGWLLDPMRREVHVYRPDHAPELLENPAQVSGEPVLKGFILEVPQIWKAMSRKT